MATLKPLGDNVIVEPMKKEEVTASGIVIPDTASKEKPQQGTIIAVGPGKLDDNGKRFPLDVKKGDVVQFSKYGPREVELDNKTYLIISQSDIDAVVEK
jgi:chaperonin GroES